MGFLLFFALMLYFSRDIKLMVLSSVVDARFWPRVIGIAGCFVSFIHALRALVFTVNMNKRRVSGEEVPAGEEMRRSESPGAGKTGAVEEPANPEAKITMALIFLFILGINVIGFLPMSALYLFFPLIVLHPREERNYKKTALAALVYSVLVYLGFRYGFNMMLPSGILRNIF
jgi:hypothetical protein